MHWPTSFPLGRDVRLLGRHRRTRPEDAGVRRGRAASGEQEPVGIFYFLERGAEPGPRPLEDPGGGAERPEIRPRRVVPPLGTTPFGYHRDDDLQAVIRKHIQMLTDAGVDVWFFDVTFQRPDSYDFDVRDAILKVLDDVKASGQRTPRIAFLANSIHVKTVEHLTETFYKPGRKREHWFLWDGKPLILTPKNRLSDEIKGFFTIRQSWAWTKGQAWFGDGRDCWPWLDHTPQTLGWQHVARQARANRRRHGRASDLQHRPQLPRRPRAEARPAASRAGPLLHRAVEVGTMGGRPAFVFVTGWNEWIAQSFIHTKGQAAMGACR